MFPLMNFLGAVSGAQSETAHPFSATPAAVNFPDYIDSTVPNNRPCTDVVEPVSVMPQTVTWINAEKDVANGGDQSFASWDVEKASSPEMGEKMKASNQLGKMIKTIGEMEQALSLSTSLVKEELSKLEKVHILLADMNQIFGQMEKIISQKDPSEEEKPALV